MCNDYDVPEQLDLFEVDVPPGWVPPSKRHIFRNYPAPFIRRPHAAGIGDDAVPDRELLIGQFALLPYWSKTRKIKFLTTNARAEEVTAKAAYKGPWARGQHCIIPAQAIYEPDWRTGSHVKVRIGRSDARPMGIAGLWDQWKDAPSGEIILSFTMLTINADSHPLMRNFHRADPKTGDDEKRMVVILPEAQYGEWLLAAPDRSMEFMQQFPADKLSAAPAGALDW